MTPEKMSLIALAVAAGLDYDEATACVNSAWEPGQDLHEAGRRVHTAAVELSWSNGDQSPAYSA